MDEGKVFLTMMGVLVGAVVVFFVYNVFIKNALLKGKSIAGKAESIMKKDMSSKCARSTFYMNNDYDNGYSQKEWMDLYKERVSSKEWDKKSEEYAEAVAPFINAIVVGDDGYLVRRGMENMAHALEKFIPGVNDSISLNYFVEPYEYVKHEKRATKYAQAKALHEEETKELRAAQDNYKWALKRYNEHRGTRSESYYEAQMQAAHAAMLSAQIKYDNRK